MNVVSIRATRMLNTILGLRVRPERSNDEGYELGYSVRSIKSYKLLTIICYQQRRSDVLGLDLRAYMTSQE
jgi:hypothetical protein